LNEISLVWWCKRWRIIWYDTYQKFESN